MTKDEAGTRIFKPTSFLKHVFYPFDRRTALILDKQKIFYKGLLKSFDKEIAYTEISDVFAEEGALEILKKGVAPYRDEGALYGPEYKPFIECQWLDEPEKVREIILENIRTISQK